MQLTETPSPLGSALLAAAVALPLAGSPAHADTAPERGTLAFKYLDYQDSQPGQDRIAVHAPAFSLLAPLGSEWSVGATVTTDIISGASPAFHNAGLTRMFDHRSAATLEVSRYFANGTLTVGSSISSEHDYLSRGGSVQYSFSGEGRNTTWTVGLGRSADQINPSTHIVRNEGKQTSDLLLGVTQVLTANDIAQLNLGGSWGSGYFSDPYKVVDNRPRAHRHSTLLARWNHFFDATQGSSRASWRYYTDDWGVRSHTLELDYVQPLPQGWTLTPSARLYTQTAARFYVDANPDILPFAPNPPDGAQFYTEDTRLAAFGAHTLGLKVAKQLDDDWSVDFKVERYEQRAGWALLGTGSPNLLPFRIRSFQVGLSRQF